MEQVEVPGTGGRRVWRFGRDEFLTRRWRYRPGEHATFIGKTQSGKTTLAFELLGVTTSPEMPGVVLVMKPVDRTPAKYTRQLGYRRVSSWPPRDAHLPAWSKRRPPGWTLWPRLGDIAADDDRLRDAFHAALAESYAQAADRRHAQPRIVFADEVVGVARLTTKNRNLAGDLDAFWMRGSGMGVALWAACQRPYSAPLNAYEQAVHLFLWRSTDRRNRKRYAEIGGVEPELVDAITSTLQGHDALYIRRTDYKLCIVSGDA